MLHSECISIEGRSAIVSTLAVGRYGDKWREIEIDDASHFSRTGNKHWHGRPILAPQEWKVLCWVERVSPPDRARPVLRLVS